MVFELLLNCVTVQPKNNSIWRSTRRCAQWNITMQFHWICLLHNRLWDYGIQTEMYGRKLSSSKLLRIHQKFEQQKKSFLAPPSVKNKECWTSYETLQSTGEMKMIVKFYMCLQNFFELWINFVSALYQATIYIFLALRKCQNDCKILKIILVPDFCPVKPDIAWFSIGFRINFFFIWNNSTLLSKFNTYSTYLQCEVLTLLAILQSTYNTTLTVLITRWGSYATSNAILYCIYTYIYVYIYIKVNSCDTRELLTQKRPKNSIKVAQDSFQHFPRRRFWWVIITTLNKCEETKPPIENQQCVVYSDLSVGGYVVCGSKQFPATLSKK